MNLANKSFKNNLTGEIVTIIDSFENIAILENKQKLKVNALMNPALYTEEIDPTNFFNNQGAYNILAEKIKNIPSDQIVDDNNEINISGVNRIDIPRGVDDSIITLTTEEDEKAALAAKYGIFKTPVESLQKQNEVFSKILGEDSQNELPKVPQYQQPVQEQITKVEVNRDYVEPIQRIEVEDPIVKMFKGVKRIIDFNISLDIKNKIPRLDFIEMMEDSYETSIIDFLAEEFTNDLLKNPSIIKDMIKSKINNLVYSSLDKISLTNEIETKEESLTKIEKPKVRAVRRKQVKKEELNND